MRDAAVRRSALLEFCCSRCQRSFAKHELLTLCPCGAPLLARYDLETARAEFQAARSADGSSAGVWRFAALLPVETAEHRITLGEGGSPLLEAPRLGAELSIPRLYVKDEGQNPTGSFKDRGMAVAVARAHSLGVHELAAPSAGNAGISLAAYAARTGVPAHVAVPADAPRSALERIAGYGADVIRVDGLLPDAASRIHELAAEHSWFDVATFREPGRVEGKKTMAFAIFEQLGEVPDVILYPTGGGTGLVAIHKAFGELEGMGVIGRDRPRLVAAQPIGCAPVVRAFDEGWEEPQPWENAATAAHGLRVPVSLAGRLMLTALRTSGGTAVAVEESEIAAGSERLATSEGISAGLESGATVAAARRLVESGCIGPDETVVLLNTAAA